MVTSLDVNAAKLKLIVRQIRDSGGYVESHPLGFLRLSLTSVDRLDPGFYLHVWTQCSDEHCPQPNDVHCHIFDLRSKILAGELVDHRYAISEDMNGDFRVCNVLYGSQFSTREPSEQRVSLACVSSNVFTAGDSYNVPQGAFHRTSINVPYTITLMQKCNVRTNQHPVNLIAVNGGNTSQFFDHLALPQEDAWNIIIREIEQLK